MKPNCILAIDQGTTGSTAVILDASLVVRARVGIEFPQHFPSPGYVEHDPNEIFASIRTAVRRALGDANIRAADIAAIGITNQRETTVLWDALTGEAVHNAIVWQCRRTTDACHRLKSAGHEALFRRKTGLVLDPYFSGTKLAWLLDHVPDARARARRGELRFGTIDSWLVARLTSQDAWVTDVSNASRTLMLDLHTGQWDPELLQLLDIPPEVLPRVVPSSGIVGHTRGLDFLPDGIPIAGIAGDQQSALFGQACFRVGEAKATYGTGAFVLMNTGATPVPSHHGLLTTIAWRLGDEPIQYALEGSVFIAGAAVQWLRDQLGIIGSAHEIEALARSVPDSGGVAFVPAFAGLGAPYWDPAARGAILGLTRGSSRGHIARACLDGIAHQVADVVEAMSQDAGRPVGLLRVDGGATANDLLMQLQADALGSPVSRPPFVEATAFGAAFLAGLGVGIFASPDAIATQWKEDRHFAPASDEAARHAERSAWKRAVGRLR
jgi:glycerol kinase